MKEHLYSRVNFKTENYLESESSDKFDVIMCLSTIKWIHINNGDNGLKTLFLKVKD
jgi:7SK snRNA methylphosphate capping enzyme